MLTKKLELIFSFVIIISAGLLIYNSYSSYQFDNNELSKEYQDLINDKEQEVLYNMQQAYGIAHKFPLIVTDEFKGRLYGLTAFQNGEIIIYLNKKVMKESMQYVLDNVIAHEYAHALMFLKGIMQTQKDGHSYEWQQICINLGGKDCRQYVDSQEIIMSKIPFMKK